MLTSLHGIKTSSVCFIFSLIIFSVISKILFDHVYAVSKSIVDEKFHIPLGMSYCKFNFYEWDPKVTTLPGLYMISSLILGPLKLCSTYWLRFTSLGASLVNMVLFYVLFKKYEKNEWSNILSALTMALIPPVYFFSLVYYTDIVSLTMILVMIVAYEKNCHFLASIFGFASVLCRQNNIIWVGLVGGRYVLTNLHSIIMEKSTRKYVSEGTERIERFTHTQTPWSSVMQLVCQPKMLLDLPLKFWLNTSSYGAVLLSFMIFLIINGSIVVGDKTAHEATIHIPQLFYFSLFSMIFAWPHFVGEVINFTKFARRHKLMLIISLLLGIIIVLKNTIAHPYMLADNRHYSFYVWNRFYGKYAFFRFAMIPVYIFAWYVIIKTLYNKNDATYILLYLPCVIVVLITQKLIDFRYYFVPYILFRLRVKNNTNSVFNLTLEFVTYLLVNAITFNLFFTKTITWHDFPDPQRLIW
ncbi:unnamed protein product [Phaedon cochleariae]|uniref:Dol-P-Glc:Glc(2)Man(9)GlcNAc(2)-PP-Dol alpha-1,2-glucosyltransferase n=1 Tax=Phaedon cochleariae TaxID=80249 RepID=A0A9P0DKA2_PHACE|nr:unnamed protein product [Phaedon cochleariae]